MMIGLVIYTDQSSFSISADDHEQATPPSIPTKVKNTDDNQFGKHVSRLRNSMQLLLNSRSDFDVSTPRLRIQCTQKYQTKDPLRTETSTILRRANMRTWVCTKPYSGGRR
jgi:hypothetical protein